MQLHAALRLALTPGRPDVVAVAGGGGKSSTVFRLAAEVAELGKRAVVAPTTRIAAFQKGWAPAAVEVTGAELPMAALARALDAHGHCLLMGPIAGDRRLGVAPELVDELAARAGELELAAITCEADGSKMRPVKAPAAHEPVLPGATSHLVAALGLDAIGAPVDAVHVHRPELVRRVLGLPDAEPARLSPLQAARLLTHPDGGARGRGESIHFTALLNKADTPVRLVVGRLVASLLARRGETTLLTKVGDKEGTPVVERWGAVAVVILAAGASTRYGRPKQVEPIGGVPMVVRALTTALASGATDVVVVTGAHEAAVRGVLETPALQGAACARLVHNPAWASGQATSMQAGLAALPAEVQAAIFMPVDQPFLSPLLLRQLIAAWQRGAALAAPAVDGQARGAPALFDRQLWPELAAVQGDTGGRAVLQHHKYAAEYAGGYPTMLIPTSPESLQDVDVPEDLTG
jgi:molybdenum cofactor cytidylyltransferase